jgi:hypothetical protein
MDRERGGIFMTTVNYNAKFILQLNPFKYQNSVLNRRLIILKLPRSSISKLVDAHFESNTITQALKHKSVN